MVTCYLVSVSQTYGVVGPVSALLELAEEKKSSAFFVQSAFTLEFGEQVCGRVRVSE